MRIQCSVKYVYVLGTVLIMGGAAPAVLAQDDLVPLVQEPAEIVVDTVEAVSDDVGLPANEALIPLNADEDLSETAEQLAQDDVQSEGEQNPERAVDTDSFNPDEFNSLLFSDWEQASILDALNAKGQTLARAPTQKEFEEELKGEATDTAPEEKVKPPPEKRFISLSGIAFRSRTDWTIWLNGARVTPTALPKELMDLKVFKDYIELKWYDEYNNEIYPIRLRTHQRFNMDKRLFMPG